MLATDTVEVQDYNQHFNEKSHSEQVEEGVRRVFLPGRLFDLVEMTARRIDEVSDGCI